MRIGTDVKLAGIRSNPAAFRCLAFADPFPKETLFRPA